MRISESWKSQRWGSFGDEGATQEQSSRYEENAELHLVWRRVVGMGWMEVLFVQGNEEQNQEGTPSFAFLL